MEFRPNPHHRRANLVVLTGRGRHTFEQAIRLQIPWVNAVSRGIATDDIALATRIIQSFRKRLEEKGKQGPGNDD